MNVTQHYYPTKKKKKHAIYLCNLDVIVVFLKNALIQFLYISLVCNSI